MKKKLKNDMSVDNVPTLMEPDPVAMGIPQDPCHDEASPLLCYPDDDLLDSLYLLSTPAIKESFSMSDPSRFSLSVVNGTVGACQAGISLESKGEAL